MSDKKNQCIEVFYKIANEVEAKCEICDNYVELKKNEISLRVYWIIERVSGVFATLSDGGDECGVYYLVEFRGGIKEDLTAAGSDDVDLVAMVCRKYALGFLTGEHRDFHEFEGYVERKIADRGL